MNRRTFVALCPTLQRMASGVLMAIAIQGVANAAEQFGYGAELKAGHSDNIMRVPLNTAAETIESASVDLSAQHETPRMQLSAAGAATYLKYVNNSYPSDYVGSFDGDLSLNLVPERFIWTTHDNFAQTVRDQTSADVPTNRENINYFTTGPTMSVLFGTRTNLSLAGQYSRLSFSDSPFDQDRYGGTASLSRNLTLNSSLSLNAASERVTFADGLPGLDYRTTRYYMGYQYAAVRTRIILDGGYSKVTSDTGSDGSVSGRLELARQVTRSTSIRLQAGRDYSDTGSSVRQLQQSWGAGTQTSTVQVSSSPFINDYTTLGIDVNLKRTSLYSGISSYRQTYKSFPQEDRAFWTATLDFGYQFTSKLGGHIGGNYLHQGFKMRPELDYNDTHAGVGMDYRLGTYTRLSLQYDHFTRSKNAAATDFRENQFWLSISYGVGERPRRGGGAGFL